MRLWTLSCLAMLTACTVGPEYQAPDMDAPEKFVSQDIFDALHVNANEPLSTGKWWEGFEDETLNQLVTRALEHNYDIAASVARVRQAQARLQFADAQDNPVVTADIDGEAQQQRPLDTSGSTESTQLFGTLGATLPIDVFGGIRRDTQRAAAELVAQREALKSVVLATSADVAAQYLRLRGTQRQLELLRESVALQEKTLSIVRARFEAGLSPELDLQRATASVQSLRARMPPLEETLRNARNRLAVLAGEYPGHYEALLAPHQDIPTYQVSIPAVMPLSVLHARPDIRRAEADLKAAIATIGVATAAYYPAFAIAGDISIGRIVTSSLSTVDVLISTLSGFVSQIITAGGERDATLAVAQARAQELLAVYEQTLRLAIEDVETSLNALNASTQRQTFLEKAVQASERSFMQAQTLYQQGLISFLDVVDAQQELADDEQSLAVERTAYAAEIAALFEALGTDVATQPIDQTQKE